MGLYKVPLSMSLLDFGIVTMTTSICVGLCCCYEQLKNARENANPRGHYVFRCLMFNLYGPCELLSLLSFIASWT